MSTKNLLLLVDDQPDNLDILFEHLERERFCLSIALGGEEALDLVARLQPELILMDVMMPGMDGFETCRRLKQSEATRDIPVLFMTALNDTVDKLKGFHAGAVDYITKPLQHEEVLARINAHLTIRRQQQTLTEKNQELAEKNRLIESQAQKLAVLARTDPLTELANRRCFLEHARHYSAFGLILGDIDHFKQINDLHGHDCGDWVLTQVAERLRHLLREADHPARWGGEEFIVLLPNTGLAVTQQVAERIRDHMENHPIPWRDQALTITLSFGVTERHPNQDFETCLKYADQALYQAKNQGRNQVSVSHRLNDPKANTTTTTAEKFHVWEK